MEDFNSKSLKEMTALLAAGNQDAITYVWQRYHRAVYYRFKTFGWNHADAEELTQDTFVSFFRQVHTLDTTRERNSFAGVLFYKAGLMAHRRSVTYGMKKKRQGLVFSADAQMEGKDGKKRPCYEFVDRRASPELAAYANELLSRVPDAYRDVFMAHIDGMEFTAIGRQYGLTQQQARKQFVKACQRITHMRPTKDAARAKREWEMRHRPARRAYRVIASIDEMIKRALAMKPAKQPLGGPATGKLRG